MPTDFTYSFSKISTYITRYFPFETVTTYIFVLLSAVLAYKAISLFFKGLTGS